MGNEKAEAKIAPMRRKGMKSLWKEGWALLAVAVIAFVGGLLIGGLGASPSTETVYVANTASEGEEAGATEVAAETTEAEAEPGGSGSPGGQLFASAGCGGCHTLAAAGTTGTTGPDLEKSLAPDDNTAGIEEMIAHPNEEIVEGYPPNVMPQNYGQTFSKAEIHQLAEFLVASTPAKP
ncbi:MAG: c-type cytochrome [Solirubrobacterales bacterium]